MRNPIIGIGVGVLAIIAGVAAVFLFTRSSGPDEFELSTDTEAESVSDAIESLDGQWTITEGSQAGYRVVEDFAGGLQDFEAVGRGSDIEGFIEIEGATITSASFDVEIATITSDDNTRDGKFRGDIMNAEEFPTAKFVLTEPIDLGDLPAPGATISTTATGDLTLRGVTNNAPVVIDAQLIGSQIEIVGSIAILFSDYNIDNPSIERIISVRDEGKVEFQLFLAR